jgi:hypothetical protein
LLKDRPIAIRTSDSSIGSLYGDLRADVDTLAHIPVDKCKFYRLKAPVLVLGQPQNMMIQACLDESNLEQVRSLYPLSQLASPQQLTTRYVCLVIELPRDEHHLCYLLTTTPRLMNIQLDETKKAIGALQYKHGDLFTCLQIMVAQLGSWSRQDVEDNLKGGHFWLPGDSREGAVAKVEGDLKDKRTYDVRKKSS